MLLSSNNGRHLASTYLKRLLRTQCCAFLSTTDTNVPLLASSGPLGFLKAPAKHFSLPLLISNVTLRTHALPVFQPWTSACLYWPPASSKDPLLLLSSNHRPHVASTDLQRLLRIQCWPIFPQTAYLYWNPTFPMDPMMSLSSKHGPQLATTNLQRPHRNPCCLYLLTINPGLPLLTFKNP